MESVAPKLERIVIAVDFGAPSMEAARWIARTLAPDAELLLVHAVDTPAAPGAATPSAEDLRGAREFAEHRLREAASALGSRGTVRVEIREDRPATAVASVAEASGADLIVVGPHGGSETMRGIGSTAERLIRMSPIPVLLVANARAHAPRHLLVPVDDVDLTPAVMHWADLFAQRGGATISLMHVLGPDEQESATKEWLSRLVRELTDARQVPLLTPAGVPGDEILAAARSTNADLIVMGRRSRGRVLPGVLGSTASTVLRESPCPVLIVVDPPDAILAEWDPSDSSA